jgi:hypothetical protein
MWKCGKCGEELDSPSRVCPHGEHETDIPSNVWLAGLDEPMLQERFESCLNAIDQNLLKTRLNKYEQILTDNLSVSINLHAASLLNFMSSERMRYVNLHDNLRANVIQGYDKELANKRNVIDGMAFKSDGQKLNFGAVNLGNNTGLTSYGEVCIILNSDEIKSRVSFLEDNVFTYYSESGAGVSFTIPAGARALWDSVYKLAIVKCTSEFFGAVELTCDQMSKLLLQPTEDKSTDRYIEAQIFPPITRATISKIIVNINAWRKVNDKGLVGKTEEHLQELSSRAQNFINYFRDEVEDNVPGVDLKVVF